MFTFAASADPAMAAAKMPTATGRARFIFRPLHRCLTTKIAV
jgi:hypothetical protein